MAELEMSMQEESVRGLLSALGVSASDAQQIFNIVKEGKDSDAESIPIHEFADTCMALKGPASAVDLAALACEIGALRGDLTTTGRLPCGSSSLRRPSLNYRQRVSAEIW